MTVIWTVDRHLQPERVTRGKARDSRPNYVTRKQVI